MGENHGFFTNLKKHF